MSKFRLQLKAGQSAPGPAEAFLTERPNKEKPVHRKDKKNFETTGKVQKCHAFLQAFQSKPTQTNTFGTKKIYAVIGQGFAATTNLATLRSSYGRDRVNDMHMVVIGLPDPWLSYVSHDMNQEVELLTLPGYANRPGLPEPDKAQRWLNSRRFASINAAELKRAATGVGAFWPSLQTLNARVTWIEKIKEKGQTRYVIHFQDRRSIKACRVDVCTGTGQQTYAEAGGERGINMSGGLWEEYLNPTKAVVDGQPRVISAEMYVTGACKPLPGGCVLVTSANSPAGIQAGEHALCEDGPGDGVGAAAELVLIASEKMNGGFPPIGRLDDHARTATGPLPQRLHHPLTQDLFPTHANVWFGEGYRVSAIEVLSAAHVAAFEHVGHTQSAIDRAGIGRRLLVTFAPGRRPRFVRGEPMGNGIEVRHTEAELKYGLFDQVVISTGRSRGGRQSAEKEEGSALQMVWGMKDALQTIAVSGYDFPVGLATDDGQLRILGAAGINNPIYKADRKAAEFKRYEESLPWQARVAGEGVTLAAKTIALANRYFKRNSADLNACVNTATLGELKRLLDDDTLAEQIFDARHWRVRPFQAKLELLRVLEYRLNFMPDIPSPDAVSKNQDIPDGLSHPALLVAIDCLNDTAVLLDDDEWIRLWNDEWTRTPFKASDLEGLLMRYANHIDDARKRVKIEAPQP